MSLTPEQNIQAFIHLIKDQPSVFLAENRVDLEQQIDTFPEEVASLSDAISTWCKKYPDIRKALSKTRKSLFGVTSGGDRGQGESNPKPKQEDYQTLLKNQIRESFPETTKEKKPSDSSK
ncbi:MAG: hypothetical protein F6K14_17395 [Symploca sp. SIO2C1]|nr:hypothetical protein [Symploca sp. SIO2C1]